MFDLPPPVLDLRQVCLNVQGKTLLKNVTLSLYPNEILCVVGSSGAGKSSTLKLAAGLCEPQIGRVSVRVGENATALAELSEQDLIGFRRRHFGFVRQNAAETMNMDQSVAANIAQPLFDNGCRSFANAMAAVRLWCEALQLDVNRLHEKPSAFSGGMLQRVQIAKAMVHAPSIILLDEPTTGLDTTIQSALLMLLLKMQRQSGVAMVLVTHDLRIARLIAHRVVVLDNGMVVEEAPPDRIIADPQHSATKRLVGAML